MKYILFDLLHAQPTGSTKFHGGGEYIKAVFKHLIQLNGATNKISVFFNKSKFIDDWILDILNKQNIYIFQVSSINDVQKILDENHFDVFFSGLPYRFKNLDIPHSTKFIGTIHGLRTIELPFDKFTYKYFHGKKSLKNRIKYYISDRYKKQHVVDYEKIINKLDDIIAVSQHTKYAILNYFPNIEKPIDIFYTPQKESPLPLNSNQLHLKKYILMISANRWEKNSYRSVIALDKLYSKGFLKDYNVVVIGKLPQKVIADIKNKSFFENLDYVNPEELETYYAYCDVFLYPSLNEGFGMPPLEAMKYGKTCVVSGVCSLPEIGGDVVYYCNPYDIDEIQNRILMASQNKISEDAILNHLEKIKQKQNDDLIKLCRKILAC